jgi:peptidoglycan hydrolase-like protein with peptidoglycan-binding domain
MRNRRGKRKLSGLILAVMAAGSLALPAVAAQSTAQAATAPAAHKTTGTPNSTHPTTSSKKKSAGSISSSKKKSKKVKGQAAPTPERITEIQGALAKKGMTDVSPTGKWDDSTTEAVRKFQSSNGLNPTGKLDALTLQKLGLGSETAGLAAPTPPPNSVNRLRNTSSAPAEQPDSEPEPRK